MNLYTHYDMKMFVSPMRVCSLLEYDHEPAGTVYGRSAGMEAKLYSSIRLDCFRTAFDDDWRDVLDGLVEQSRVVVVDALHVTEHTVAEAVHLKEHDYLYKTIFLSNHKGEVPVLERAFGPMKYTKESICIADYVETFRILKLIFHDLAIPSPRRPVAEFLRSMGDSETFNFKSTTAEFLVVQGNERLKEQRFREAQEYFLESLHSTMESHESILSNLAIVSLSLGRLDDAQERVAKALEIKPEHPNAVYFAGIVQEQLGNFSQAREHFEKFLMIAPQNDALRIQYCRKRLRRA